MIGIILAAGVGSRLRPMTNNKPKCLVTVAGKAILDYQLSAYKKAGITDIYIIVGYEGEKIRNHCRYIKDLNITIIENEEYEDTNNMYSLFLARKYAYGKGFILNNADLSVDDNIIKSMLLDERKDLIAVDVGLYNEESMKVTLNEKNKISNISKLIDEANSTGCSIDFYKFSSASSEIFFDEIERIIIKEGNKKDWTEIAMQRLFNKQSLQFEVINISGYPWVEIDNYDDLALADKIFSQCTKKISDYECYCFDLDGTVYVGDKVINSVVNEIKKLKELGKKIRFISNNSSKNKSQYVERLKEYGIDSSIDEIKLSTESALSFLKKTGAKKIYVIGTTSLEEEVSDAGFEICTDAPDFILLGYDTQLNYTKLVNACRLINKGVDYIATHCDIFCPTENGPIPDIGTMINMLQSTTGKAPYRIFGKPNPDLIDLIIETEKINKNDVLMIGDRLYTDILMARNANVDSVLVLTGDTRREEVENAEIIPTYILKSFSI